MIFFLGYVYIREKGMGMLHLWEHTVTFECSLCE